MGSTGKPEFLASRWVRVVLCAVLVPSHRVFWELAMQQPLSQMICVLSSFLRVDASHVARTRERSTSVFSALEVGTGRSG